MRMISRKTASQLSKESFAKGEAILIDKDYRWSSFKVIHEFRKVVGVRKMGHAGTLDPLATGLLIICSAKMTKTISTFQDLPKVYTGTIYLGKTTPTMDAESQPTEEKSIEGITEEQIREAVLTFTGEIEQVPPMYSAVNHQGKKLYEIARKGKTVHREPRKIHIYRFEITEITLPEVKFEVECSKGTYIRVLANDLGAVLGCGGYLSELRRTAIGEYRVEDAFTIHELRKMPVIDLPEEEA